MSVGKKIGLIAITAIAIIAFLLAWKWPVIKFGLEDGGKYTENDRQVYGFFTPDILKKMPRITANYEFDYHTVSGPGSVGNSLTFHGTTDTSQIDTYLNSLGYVKQQSCMVQGVCWKGKDPTEDIVVSAVPEINVVLVQVDYTPGSR
ncbi:hypothetical protein [Kosakonia sp. MH5]|uniref:hypothetical protein n=1 Tax=Kosakonia sp. MH5 TaxID=2202822 RepID=UPI00137501FE|nr:hypothetical protein [Kosakonia sp. MH5]NCF05045.1 hypothetical protein [Kosakonia sp. MH5]